jgi:hypothetical protein
MLKLANLLLVATLVCLFIIASENSRQINEIFGCGSTLYQKEPHAPLKAENEKIWLATAEVVKRDLSALLNENIEFTVTSSKQTCQVHFVAIGDDEVSNLIGGLTENFIQERFRAQLDKSVNTDSVSTVENGTGRTRWDTMSPHARIAVYISIISIIFLFGTVRRLSKK